jgi:hypothetical protein
MLTDWSYNMHLLLWGGVFWLGYAAAKLGL